MADMVYKTKSAELPECINAGYGKTGYFPQTGMEEMPMEKKNLDWGNIGFSYMPTDMRYVADYKDGAWGEGRLTSDSTVVLNECAGILQYCRIPAHSLSTTVESEVSLPSPHAPSL